MPTPINIADQLDQDSRCYSLLAKIINKAVKDFNNGSIAQKKDAAAFFRGDRFKWMADVVGGTVKDITKHRLNADPFDLKALMKQNKDRIKGSHPPVYIEWKGVERTATEWAEYLGIEVNTFRARVKKFGMVDRVFER